MSTPATVQAESLSLSPSALLALFCLDGTAIGMTELFYFYDGVSANYQPLVFDGITYTPFPIKMEEMSIDSSGQLSRPKLTTSNAFGFVSALLLGNANLVGAKLTRTRVYARFIDAVNFPRNRNPYGTPDPSAAYPPDIFYVNRKVAENQQIVQFELTSLIELNGVKLPKRQILATVCQWKYRDPSSCAYSGAPVTDRANKLFVGGAGTYGLSSLTDQGAYNSSTTYNRGDYVYINSTLGFTTIPIYYVCLVNGTVGAANSPISNQSGAWVEDACNRSIAACKLRYPAPAVLRGSFFPGVSQASFIAQ